MTPGEVSAKKTTRKTGPSIKSAAPVKPATATTALRTAPRKTLKRKTVARTEAGKLAIQADERQHMITQAAFLISRTRKPTMGTPESDWYQAEAVIDMIFDVVA